MGKNNLKMVAQAIILAALGLTSCTGVSPSSFYAQQEQQRYKVIDHIVSCNVTVMYPTGVGSGVVYRKNGKCYVLTASHIIADPPETILQDNNGHDFAEPLINQTFGTKSILICKNTDEGDICFAIKGKLAYVDPYNDFAILEFEREPAHEPEISEFYLDRLKVGERIFVVGNSTLDIDSIATGIIQHPNRDPIADQTSRRFIQTDCAGGPGCSGGGLYREVDGKCIGIVLLKNESGLCLYAMPITKIKEILLNSCRKDLAP